MNSLLLSTTNLGGAFHAGVEVGGLEWSFAYNPQFLKPGVQSVKPQCDMQHNFRQTVQMGCTTLSASEIRSLISDLIEEYPGTSYSLLTRNCCHFADHFCQRLGVGPIPDWVYRMARIGASAEEAMASLMGGGSQVEYPVIQKHPHESDDCSYPEALEHEHVDADRLHDVLYVADDMLDSGRACELFPVCRSFSLADAGDDFLESLGKGLGFPDQDMLNSGYIDPALLKAADIRVASPQKGCPNGPGRGRTGVSLSVGGC